jgi:hypothetical protein
MPWCRTKGDVPAQGEKALDTMHLAAELEHKQGMVAAVLLSGLQYTAHVDNVCTSV